MWQFVPGRNSNARGHPFACCERPLFHGFHKCQGRWSHGGGLDLCATGDRFVNSGRLKLRSGGKAASVVTQEGYALTELDPREADAKALSADTEQGREALADLFSDSDFMEHSDKVALLAIGRALLALDEDDRLSETEKMRLKRGSERIFTFSDAIASKFRQVARAIRDGRIPEDRCPSSYTVAYDLASLPEAALEQARQLNLIRSDVPRSAIVQFRQQVAKAAWEADEPTFSLLQRQRANLERERDQLQRRLDKILLDLA